MELILEEAPVIKLILRETQILLKEPQRNREKLEEISSSLFEEALYRDNPNYLGASLQIERALAKVNEIEN